MFGYSDRTDAGRLIVAAWRGREADARDLAAETLRGAFARGRGSELSFVHHALAILEVGLGSYDAALEEAREATASGSLYVSTTTMPEVVEAAVRSDRRTEAQTALSHLEGSARAAGTDWGLGMLARSSALLAEGDSADALYLEAIQRLGRCRVRPHLARAHLLYGEWLRRRRRTREARSQLRRAHQAFETIGAHAFADRAQRELAAAGDTDAVATPAALDLLTPQEARIARMVSEGMSNRSIAEELILSRRTVEYHVKNIFAKLGVSSRTQMTRVVIQLDEGS